MGNRMRLNEGNCWVLLLDHKNAQEQTGGRVAGNPPSRKGPGDIGQQQLNLGQCVPRWPRRAMTSWLVSETVQQRTYYLVLNLLPTYFTGWPIDFIVYCHIFPHLHFCQAGLKNSTSAPFLTFLTSQIPYLICLSFCRAKTELHKILHEGVHYRLMHSFDDVFC